MALPSDFDIGAPFSSSVQPCVTTCSIRRAPRMPTPISSELWNQPRYWSGPSRYMSAGHMLTCRASSTARCEEPESNHTSRMSISLRQFAAPQEHFVPGGSSSSAECVYQASAPSRSKNGSTWRSAAKSFKLLAAGVAIENDQRHAPEALARNAPVGALGDHFVHAVFAPLPESISRCRFPRARAHAAVALSAPELSLIRVHVDEPLLGGAENHRIVAAPAMRIAVREFASRRRACRASSAVR